MTKQDRAACVMGDLWRIAAIPLLLAVSQGATGEEWEDVFEIASLPAIEQPANEDSAEPADVDACWEAAEEEFIDSPCDGGSCGTCDGACCNTCDGGCYLTAELEACAKCMASQGIVYDIVVPQFYQGVTHG